MVIFMNVTILCAIVGVAYLASRIYKEKKNQDKLKEYDLTKYQCAKFSTGVIIALAVMIVLSVIVFIWGIQNKSEVHSSIGIIMFIMGFAEIYYAYMEMRLYYNDKFCILNGKRISYNHIKAVTPKSILFIAKGMVELYSGEKINVYKKALDIIREYIKK